MEGQERLHTITRVGRIRDAADIRARQVVCIVGGGGKTTLMCTLARELMLPVARTVAEEILTRGHRSIDRVVLGHVRGRPPVTEVISK